MRAWLLKLRLHGVRITGDRPPADWVEGFLSFREQRTAARSFDCLVFRRVIDPHPVPNWAELYEPRLLSIGAGSIWLRGFERVDGVGFVQGWRLDVQRAIKPDETYGPPMGELGAGTSFC
jgi:hypothetical protein